MIKRFCNWKKEKSTTNDHNPNLSETVDTLKEPMLLQLPLLGLHCMLQLYFEVYSQIELGSTRNRICDRDRKCKFNGQADFTVFRSHWPARVSKKSSAKYHLCHMLKNNAGGVPEGNPLHNSFIHSFSTAFPVRGRRGPGACFSNIRIDNLGIKTNKQQW